MRGGPFITPTIQQPKVTTTSIATPNIVAPATMKSTRNASRAQLFLYSAATHNPHRIHYDRDYAAVEGHPDIIVHGPLQGAWLSQYLARSGPPQAPLLRAFVAVELALVPLCLLGPLLPFAPWRSNSTRTPRPA